MHDALAVLVVAKWFQGGEQGRFFFGKHGGHLPFGSAVDAGIGTPCFPTVQVGLRFLQTLEVFSLERRFLGVSDAGFNFPFGKGR